jgi:hypothetical protein
MKRILGSVLGLALGLAAGAAWADSTSGTVEKLDPSRNIIWVGGVPYQVEEQSAPLKYGDIKVGQKVTIEFIRSGNGNVASMVAPAK